MKFVACVIIFSAFSAISASEDAYEEKELIVDLGDDLLEVDADYDDTFEDIESFEDESPDLYISGPEIPVLEGDEVTLECKSSNDSDMSNFTFQKYLRYTSRWMDIDNQYNYRCWYYNLNVSRPDGGLFLNINELYSWQSGPYRCIRRGNESDDVVVSDEFTIPVSYLRDIYFESNGSWQPRISDVIYVEEGSDINIKCTAKSSSEPEYEWIREPYNFIMEDDTLILDNVQVEDSGDYTCRAKSTDLYALMKTKSFELRVVPPTKTLGFSSDFPFTNMLLYVLVPSVLLLISVLVITVVVVRQKKRKDKKPQISLVYGEKFSPIYKGCIKPIERKDSDTQPLVA